MTDSAKDILETWPEPSREAAQLVVDKYGEPTEATPTQLVWQDVGTWKRLVATKEYYEHNFPAPHIDAVESFIDYAVPTEMFTRWPSTTDRWCHDEEANNLALNLMHDIVQGEKSVDEARDYYAKEFLDYRRQAHALHGEAPFHSGKPRQRRPG